MRPETYKKHLLRHKKVLQEKEEAFQKYKIYAVISVSVISVL